MRSPTSTPIVSCCCLKISFLFFATVIIFFTAGLLLCFEHVDHWELIASRWRPAFSSHLISRVTVHVKYCFICPVNQAVAGLAIARRGAVRSSVSTWSRLNRAVDELFEAWKPDKQVEADQPNPPNNPND